MIQYNENSYVRTESNLRGLSLLGKGGRSCCEKIIKKKPSLPEWKCFPVFMCCGGLTLAGSYAPTQSLARFPLVVWGRDLYGQKWGKISSWVEIKSFCKWRKKKKEERSDARAVTYHQQTNAQPVSKQSYFRETSLQVLLLSIMSYGNKYPFALLGSAVTAVSSPSLLPTLCLCAGTALWEMEKALLQCKCCSVIAKTLVCFGHKSKPQQHMFCYEAN